MIQSINKIKNDVFCLNDFLNKPIENFLEKDNKSEIYFEKQAKGYDIKIKDMKKNELKECIHLINYIVVYKDDQGNDLEFYKNITLYSKEKITKEIIKKVEFRQMLHNI